MFEIVLVSIIAGILFGITWGNKAFIGIALGIILSSITMYLVQPPLIPFIILLYLASFLGIGSVIGGAMNSEPIRWGRSGRSEGTSGAPVIGGTIALVLIFGLLLWGIFVPVMVADSLYRLPRVTVVEGTTSAISPDHIRIVPEANALWRAEKMVGTLGYKEDAYDGHIQSVNGSLAWLCPYDFNGAFSAFWYGSEGVSGYVVIDAEHPFAEPVLVSDTRMVITPNAIFGNDLHRHIYYEYPTYYIKEPVFHIDDRGNPKWVTMLAKPTLGGITGEVPVGIVVTNPETGENQFHYMDDIPSWVKRTWAESTVERYLEWWGAYIHGFWNTIFGQRDIKVPTGGIEASERENGRWTVDHGDTDVFLIMGVDNRLYWYTAYSTEGNRNSMVGYMLVDVLTGKFTFHAVPGTYNDLSAASNVQQNSQVSNVMGHHVTQPIMYVINGEEIWIIPVVTAQKENAGVGVVRAKDGETFYGATLEESLAKYYGTKVPTTTPTTKEDILAQLKRLQEELAGIIKQVEAGP